MSQRKKAGRRARRAARRTKVQAIAQKAAPVAKRIYEAGGKDAIELAAGLVPGGAVAAKGLTKGIDLLMSRPNRTKKAKGKAKILSGGTGLGYSIQADEILAIAPEPEGSEVAIADPWYKKPKILAAAAAAVLLGVVAMARKKRKGKG